MENGAPVTVLVSGVAVPLEAALALVDFEHDLVELVPAQRPDAFPDFP